MTFRSGRSFVEKTHYMLYGTIVILFLLFLLMVYGVLNTRDDNERKHFFVSQSKNLKFQLHNGLRRGALNIKSMYSSKISAV